MTPREKWRADCMQYLGITNTEHPVYSDDRLRRLVKFKRDEHTQTANYLLIEYLNVKTSDDDTKSSTIQQD